MKRPLAGLILALFSAWFGLSGCVTVLDLDGYVDAATALCACPGFEKVDSCATIGQARLSAATDAEREAWLSTYDAKQCGTLCERAADCYGALPGCQGSKPGCDCCVWNDAIIECQPSTCQACRSCQEIATIMDDGTKKPCVGGRALLADLQKCACSAACASDCIGFCQNYDLLQTGLETCSQCLEATCKPLLDACLADKP